VDDERELVEHANGTPAVSGATTGTSSKSTDRVFKSEEQTAAEDVTRNLYEALKAMPDTRTRASFCCLAHQIESTPSRTDTGLSDPRRLDFHDLSRASARRPGGSPR